MLHAHHLLVNKGFARARESSSAYLDLFSRSYIAPLLPTVIDEPLNGLFDFKIESAPSNGF